MTNMFYRIFDPQYGVAQNSYILVIKLIGEKTISQEMARIQFCYTLGIDMGWT